MKTLTAREGLLDGQPHGITPGKEYTELSFSAGPPGFQPFVQVKDDNGRECLLLAWRFEEYA